MGLIINQHYSFNIIIFTAYTLMIIFSLFHINAHIHKREK